MDVCARARFTFKNGQQLFSLTQAWQNALNSGMLGLIALWLV
jgi:hypothetical protein